MIRKLRKWIVGLLVMGAIAIIFFFPKPTPLLTSSLTGLQQLKTSAETATDYSEAVSNGLPSVIEFYANWCTTCQGMAPLVYQIEQDYGEDLNWVMIDIDNPKYASLIEQYHVKGVPQFTFLDRQLNVEQTLVGKIPKSVLINFIS